MLAFVVTLIMRQQTAGCPLSWSNQVGFPEGFPCIERLRGWPSREGEGSGHPSGCKFIFLPLCSLSLFETSGPDGRGRAEQGGDPSLQRLLYKANEQAAACILLGDSTGQPQGFLRLCLAPCCMHWVNSQVLLQHQDCRQRRLSLGIYQGSWQGLSHAPLGPKPAAVSRRLSTDAGHGAHR